MIAIAVDDEILMLGALEIESTVGVGTKVLITIPKEVQK